MLAWVPEDEAEGLEEPEIVAELGLNGQIMRRILQAGAHQPCITSSRITGTPSLTVPRSQAGQSLSPDNAAVCSLRILPA